MLSISLSGIKLPNPDESQAPSAPKAVSSSSSDTDSASDKSDKEKKADGADDSSDDDEPKEPIKNKKAGLRLMNDIASEDEDDSQAIRKQKRSLFGF